MPNQRSRRFVSAMRSVAQWCVLATVAVLPLVSLNPTILGIGTYPLAVDQAELPRAVLVIVLAGVGVAAWALSEAVDPRGVRWSTEWWALGAFGLLAIVSALRSPYPDLAYIGSWFHWEGLLTLLAYAMWCFLAAQVADRRGVVSFVRAGAVVGAVVAAYGIVQALGVDWATWLDSATGPRRAFSTWSNPDFFGGYLLFPLAFGIVLAAGETERRWRFIGDVSLGLVLFATVASLTRGAWLVGTLLTVLLLVVLWRRGLVRWRLLLGAAAVIAAALVVVSITSGGAVAERAVSAFSPDDGGVAARVEIWQKTAPYAFGHALTGSGPDTFEDAFVRLQANGIPYFANDPHNVLLYLLITLGVAATACVVLFAGVVVVRASRVAFDACKGFEHLALVGVWGGSVGVRGVSPGRVIHHRDDHTVLRVPRNDGGTAHETNPNRTTRDRWRRCSRASVRRHRILSGRQGYSCGQCVPPRADRGTGGRRAIRACCACCRVEPAQPSLYAGASRSRAG